MLALIKPNNVQDIMFHIFSISLLYWLNRTLAGTLGHITLRTKTVTIFYFSMGRFSSLVALQLHKLKT